MKKQILVILVLLLISPVSVEAFYNLIDLGTLGGPSSRAYSINNNGQIVGSASAPIYGRSTLFDATGGGNNINLGVLPSLPAGVSVAISISNNGQIGGWAENEAGNQHATLFDATGGGNNIDLGTLGGPFSTVRSINTNGQIVGWANTGEVGHVRATLFDATGGGNNINLGTLGGTSSNASSINNNGQIVGSASYLVGNVAAHAVHATLFDATGGGNNIDLGTLDGPDSLAYSINNNGQIVGYASASDVAGDWHATLFDATGGGNNIDLGTLGGSYSRAYSINNIGQIVGWADVAGYERAILFDATGGGANIDLNTLIDPTSGWTLREALSINDNGWIVGYGINPDGYEGAFLLTPEPTTLLLLGLGVPIISGLRKKARG
ncbi:MAG: DUF3466 family protein [Planctomycetota bacterium]